MPFCFLEGATQRPAKVAQVVILCENMIGENSALRTSRPLREPTSMGITAPIAPHFSRTKWPKSEHSQIRRTQYAHRNDLFPRPKNCALQILTPPDAVRHKPRSHSQIQLSRR